ncbi:MAG: hypothetical protein E5Y79_27725 [Mesorhizobium sp.]|uniref:hypothetical protein n=1 Tax=Mesorhizobium sp. TaxID=1871066 RepID=UPI001209FB6C|nr:hypothetical protein [Mesorhizobium sp.]TIL56784.1 MAG: hypothetical protein E5Y79_27725 [Mesorhizobium sp.]
MLRIRYRRHENVSTVKIEELVDAIRSGGKVILTDDDASLDASGEVIGFGRTKYIAIYAATAVEYDKDNGLRLNLSERLANLE